MVTEFSDILARNIIHICFGEDLADIIFELQVKENGKWIKKSFTFKESIFVFVPQVIMAFYDNISNPINWLYPHTEVIINVSSDALIVRENCKVVRDWIKDYINERKLGKRSSSVSGNTDLLSVMLER